jgi:hypothetical protein
MTRNKTTKSDSLKKKNLLSNKRWETFCQIYAFDREFSGNATHAYAIAYDYDIDNLSRDDAVYEGGGTDPETRELIPRKMIKRSSYDLALNVCATTGRKLLRKPQIDKRLTELYLSILKDTLVDSRLAEHISQREDRGISIQAIREYNKLGSRIKTKIEIVEPEVDEETRNKSKDAIGRFIARKITGQG